LILAIGLLRADSKSVWLDQTSKDLTDAMFASINTQTHKRKFMYVYNLPQYQIPHVYLQRFFGYRQQTEISRKCSHFVNSYCTKEEIRSKNLHIILRLSILHSSVQHYVTLLWLPPVNSALWSCCYN